MSLMAAVDVAVRLELVDHGTVPFDYKNRMNAAAPGGYGHDASTMLDLLQRIAFRLRLDTPALKFDWPRADVSKCLGAKVSTLVALIAADTATLDSQP